jgi:hypothetical protein
MTNVGRYPRHAKARGPPPKFYAARTPKLGPRRVIGTQKALHRAEPNNGCIEPAAVRVVGVVEHLAFSGIGMLQSPQCRHRA